MITVKYGVGRRAGWEVMASRDRQWQTAPDVWLDILLVVDCTDGESRWAWSSRPAVSWAEPDRPTAGE